MVELKAKTKIFPGSSSSIIEYTDTWLQTRPWLMFCPFPKSSLDLCLLLVVRESLRQRTNRNLVMYPASPEITGSQHGDEGAVVLLIWGCVLCLCGFLLPPVSAWRAKLYSEMKIEKEKCFYMHCTTLYRIFPSRKWNVQKQQFQGKLINEEFRAHIYIQMLVLCIFNSSSA